MKVLHVIARAAKGGAETFVLDLMRAYYEKGDIQHGVCALLKDGESDYRKAVSRYTSRFTEIGGGLSEQLRGLRVNVLEMQPNVVVYHLNFMSAIYSLATLGAGAGNIFVFHAECDRHYKSLRKRIAFRMSAQLLNHSRWPILVCSQAARNKLARLYGLRISRTRTYYLGVDTSKFAPCDADRGLARQEMEIPPEDFVLGCVANLTPAKNHTFLLKVFRELLGTRNLWLVVVGDGPLRRVLEEEAEECGIQHRVRFMGSRKDVPRLLNGFDVFVMTSIAEGLPLALLEALACGLPVVAPKLGGIAEVVTNEVGILYEPGEVLGAVDAVKRAVVMSREPGRRERCRSRAREFERKVAFREYESLLEIVGRRVQKR